MTVDEPDNPTEEVEVTGNGAFDHFPIFCYILGTWVKLMKSIQTRPYMLKIGLDG